MLIKLPKQPRRVVVTGLGAETPIGRTYDEIRKSLFSGTPGIYYSKKFEELGFSSCVRGRVLGFETEDEFTRRERRFMGVGRVLPLGFSAARKAVRNSGLEQDVISSERTGVIVGTGGISTLDFIESWNALLNNVKPGNKRKSLTRAVGPYAVVPNMCSGLAAKIANDLKVKGPSYAITSACATSAHCIGEAATKIALGCLDVAIAGGAESSDYTVAFAFDAMSALSSKFNDTPNKASRPFDVSRDGFVDAEGAGILILEEYEHAKARGAYICAEIVGYGASSDGYNMVAPSGEGAVRCMKSALGDIPVSEVTYINAHGTSTPAGDAAEIDAVKKVFGRNIPKISSTKSLTGHGLGSAGAMEAIFSILMMREYFVAASVNIEKVDPEFGGVPILTSRFDGDVDVVMSNSFGFGGTNASLVFSKI